jgi:hypothetical protein
MQHAWGQLEPVFHAPGHKGSTHLMGAEAQSTPQQAELPQWAWSYGTITCGLRTMQPAWGQLEQVFSAPEHEDYSHLTFEDF